MNASGKITVVTLIFSIFLWLQAIKSPLWLDETISFWVIKAGFSHISSRMGAFPAYFYILWLWTQGLGTSVIALRILSVLAMLVAVYFLYLTARELMTHQIALTVTVVFSVHPIVSFAAIDARPYAFAALAICASIYTLVRLRNSSSRWLAALLGLTTASILYFHLLFVVILPALALCLLFSKPGNFRLAIRQFAVAALTLCLACIPIIVNLLFMVRTRGAHPFHDAPTILTLLYTLAPFPFLVALAFALIVVAVRTPAGTAQWHLNHDWFRLLVCTSLTLIPLGTLLVVSMATPMHVFVTRYQIVGIPGLALCYGLVIKRIDLPILRACFCLVLVLVTAAFLFANPRWAAHAYSWKYATDFAEQNTARDHAPVLMCSDLPESTSMPMPVGNDVYDSTLFPSLTYYKLHAPVIGLPRTLDEQAMQIGSHFLEQAAAKRERFLAMAYAESYPTLDWLRAQASPDFDVHTLGTFDAVQVVEFVPRRKPQSR